MQRTLWILLGWSPEYGAATTVVAVLGIDHGADGRIDRHIEWVPREYQRCLTWRKRIASTPVSELPAHIELWENSVTAPAARVEPVPSAPDLAAAVQCQLDDLLGFAG
ncbi:hypothetical protein ACFQ68_07100 [Amycolatopsis japonica]|uniref:hypothetical protein n=1 Tax=Amycolatopsis japonica TaxID=208439 RepID=UPI00367205FF